MSDHGPTYTWRHGIAWLAAAAVVYWILSGRAGMHVSSGNMALGYVFVAGATLVGVFLIAQGNYHPRR